MTLLIDIFNYGTTIVALASVVCAMTPTTKDDTIVGYAYKFLEILAVNIGKAKE